MLIASGVTAPVFGLRREIDRLLQESSGTPRNGHPEWVPAVDIRETEHELTIAVDLPGVEPEKVEVTADDGVLMIRGERAEEGTVGDEGRYHLVERNTGPFMRHFHLPGGIDTNKIDANFEHGMLRVRIQKATRPQPKKVAIRVGRSTDGPLRQDMSSGASRQEAPKKASRPPATK